MHVGDGGFLIEIRDSVVRFSFQPGFVPQAAPVPRPAPFPQKCERYTIGSARLAWAARRKNRQVSQMIFPARIQEGHAKVAFNAPFHQRLVVGKTCP